MSVETKNSGESDTEVMNGETVHFTFGDRGFVWKEPSAYEGREMAEKLLAIEKAVEESAGDAGVSVRAINQRLDFLIENHTKLRMSADYVRKVATPKEIVEAYSPIAEMILRPLFQDGIIKGEMTPTDSPAP